MNNKNRSRWECRACHKIAYGSEARANQAMHTIQEVTGREVRPVRAYPCPYGNGWHMTSQKEGRFRCI